MSLKAFQIQSGLNILGAHHLIRLGFIYPHLKKHLFILSTVYAEALSTFVENLSFDFFYQNALLEDADKTHLWFSQSA